MKICSSCVLPETFPGIRFDENGVCQHCIRYEKVPQQRHLETKSRYRLKFRELTEKIKGKGTYDALVAYSGGKDSTYTLRYLSQETGLKVLAITFDNGFLSPAAFKNISNVTSALNVDQIFFAPGYQSAKTAFQRSTTMDVYPMKSLERASAVCNTCMYLAKAIILKTAIEKGIPIIAYGWSPGQAPVQSSVMKLSESMIRQNQGLSKNCLEPLVGEDVESYLLQEWHYQLIEDHGRAFNGSYLFNAHPLAFIDYNEEEIVELIGQLGWNEPTDTDANSTNCLLNSFANLEHLGKHGFHPYAFEISGLVREGYMTREEGLEKLNKEPSDSIVKEVERKLNIQLK